MTLVCFVTELTNMWLINSNRSRLANAFGISWVVDAFVHIFTKRKFEQRFGEHVVFTLELVSVIISSRFNARYLHWTAYLELAHFGIICHCDSFSFKKEKQLVPLDIFVELWIQPKFGYSWNGWYQLKVSLSFSDKSWQENREFQKKYHRN